MQSEPQFGLIYITTHVPLTTRPGGYRNALEDPWEEAREDMYTRSVSPEQAPDKPTYLDLEFEGGNPVAIDGQKLSPATLLTQLNKVFQTESYRW